MAWSEYKKNETRENIGLGAMVKNGRGEYGFFCASDAGIKILGVQPSEFLPVPSDKIVATFSREMVENSCEQMFFSELTKRGIDVEVSSNYWEAN